MKKTYEKPQVTVVDIETEALMAASGIETINVMGFSSETVNNTEGAAKTTIGGLWDDDDVDE